MSFIQEKLDDNYSPDVICGLLRLKNMTSMCTQTIYNLISIGKLIYKNNTPYKNKKVKEPVQKVAFNNTRRRSILERPFKMIDRIFGNWEMDNGIVFLDMNGLEKSVFNTNSKRTTIYYANPFSSWQRGSNENCNKIIRKFIKKGTDIKNYSVKFIEKMQDWINNYPRKIFGYRTAKEMFEENLNNCLICCNHF